MDDKIIIHQIAPKDTSVWHPFWPKCHQSWKDKYEVILWNDEEDVDNLIKDHYPAYWNLYQSFPFHVMKLDFVRLAILHRYGGLYADMDVYCYNTIPEEYFDTHFAAIENLTEEYTSAKYENAMMYSKKGNQFLINTMNFVKMFFIDSRNKFEKPYERTPKNDTLINNITGSGMLEAAIATYCKEDIGKFPCELFNNRAASYDSSFYTKHAHSSIWGKEYINRQDNNKILIIDGSMYVMDSIKDELKHLISDEPHYITSTFDFDFMFDYTDGKYLQSDTNLEEFKTYIKDVEVKIHEYLRQSNDS